MIGLAPWKMFGDKWLTTRGAAKLFFLGTLLVPALAIQVFGGIVVPQLPRWERTLWGNAGHRYRRWWHLSVVWYAPLLDEVR